VSDGEWVDIDAIAEALGYSTSNVMHLVRTGRLPRADRPGKGQRRHAWLRAATWPAVEAILAERRRDATPGPEWADRHAVAGIVGCSVSALPGLVKEGLLPPPDRRTRITRGRRGPDLWLRSRVEEAAAAPGMAGRRCKFTSEEDLGPGRMGPRAVLAALGALGFKGARTRAMKLVRRGLLPEPGPDGAWPRREVERLIADPPDSWLANPTLRSATTVAPTDLAARLGITKQELFDLARAGRIPPPRTAEIGRPVWTRPSAERAAEIVSAGRASSRPSSAAPKSPDARPARAAADGK
jgi:hypothetical protein